MWWYCHLWLYKSKGYRKLISVFEDEEEGQDRRAFGTHGRAEVSLSTYITWRLLCILDALVMGAGRCWACQGDEDRLSASPFQRIQASLI